MGPLSWQEMAFIFVLALLIFGPKKLPELGKTIGKAMTEFRRASNELKSTFDREMQSLERENESLKETTRQYTDTYNYDSYDTYNYDYGSTDSTATTTSTNGASAVPGADSQTAALPEGVVAQGSEAPAATPPAAAGTPEAQVADGSEAVKNAPAGDQTVKS